MIKNISIAGLGWLGIPLARQLEDAGYSVKGSVTSQKKADELTGHDMKAIKVTLTESGVQGNPGMLLSEADLLIIMIPPGLRKNTGVDYYAKIAHFIPLITAASVEQVLFIGSTSVFSDAQGLITEKDVPVPETRSGKQLLQVEQLLLEQPNFTTTILRFGGLFGGSRQPVRYLAGRSGLLNGNAPVNLIHRTDAIGIISSLIQKRAFGNIYHGVYPDHPLKKEYYTQKALDLKLDPPVFEAGNDTERFKQVDSVNVPELLNYRFKKAL